MTIGEVLELALEPEHGHPGGTGSVGPIRDGAVGAPEPGGRFAP